MGKDFEFTRILKPLEPFRDDLLVLTGWHIAQALQKKPAIMRGLAAPI